MQRCHAFAHWRDLEAMPSGRGVTAPQRWEVRAA